MLISEKFATFIVGLFLGMVFMVVFLILILPTPEKLSCMSLQQDLGYPVVFVYGKGCMWEENGTLHPILVSPVR